MSENLKVNLPHNAVGMYRDEKTGMYMLAEFKYDQEGNVVFMGAKELNKDKYISRDMFKVKVIEKGIIGV
jgi:hypothetical protein